MVHSAFRSSRRRFACALGAAALLPLPLAGVATPLRERRRLLGTWVKVVVADPRAANAQRAIGQAFDEMNRLAGLMSAFDSHSVVAWINREAGGRPVPVPPEVMAVLGEARRVHRRTGGAFDPTVGRLTAGLAGTGALRVPDEQEVRAALAHIGLAHLELDERRGTARLDDPSTRLDLGGIAKLPILQAGLDVLEARGVRGALVDGGGDVLASTRDDGRAWRVGVRDPAAPERLLAIVRLRAGVVASSGDYERFVMHEGRRYHHIVEPATGRPTRGIRGVTLVGERVDEVNGLGAAAMVAGPRGAAALLERCGAAQALFVREEGGAWIGPALAQRLEPAPG